MHGRVDGDGLLLKSSLGRGGVGAWAGMVVRCGWGKDREERGWSG